MSKSDYITIDLTGFYFSYKAKVSDILVNANKVDLDTVTVEDVLLAAKGKTGKNGGVLTTVDFSTNSKTQKRTLARIEVDFNANNPPRSRQLLPDGSEFPTGLSAGKYAFDDRKNNQIAVQDTDILFSLAFQYYVFDHKGQLKSGSNRPDDLDRVVYGAGDSTNEFKFEGGELVRYRLVGIGGLENGVINRQKQMDPAQRNQFVAMSANMSPRARFALASGMLRDG